MVHSAPPLGDGHQGLHQRRVQAGEGQLPLPDQEHGEGRHQEVAGRGQGDTLQVTSRTQNDHLDFGGDSDEMQRCV